MPNVFISHSSRDKPFVRKLASGLLSEGFPVWLDTWAMEVGDSLLDQIYEGLEQSGVAILVMSRNAVESGWVNRELNAALSKEQQTARKFLVPIKIDDCTVPLKVADRLYADFSPTFSEPFSALKKVLERQHATELPVPSDRELLALRFTRAVHLDKVSYAKNLESHLRMLADRVLEHERLLSEGIALMSNHGCSPDAAYWFAKLVRGEAVYRLWSAQVPDALDNIKYGEQWACATLGSHRAAAEFFETASVEAVHLWGQGTATNPFSLWVGNEVLKDIRNEEGVYEGPQLVSDVCAWDAGFDKYLFPQMVFKHLRKGTPMIWDLGEAYLGLR